MGGVLAVLLMILLIIFANFGAVLAGATRVSNFTQFDSSCNTSCNTPLELEDKRGIPTGANPLHNR